VVGRSAGNAVGALGRGRLAAVGGGGTRWVHGHVFGHDRGRGQWGLPGEAQEGLILFVEESIGYPEVHIRRCRCGGGQVDRGGMEEELHQERAHDDGIT
jgi:hypothetical protein